MRTVCLLQARLGSTRLPGKVLADLAGEPMLARIIRRLARASAIDRIVVATTGNPEDDAVAETALREGVFCHRGPCDDVLTRLVETIDRHPAEFVVHATGDNPLVEPSFIDTLAEAISSSDADFAFMPGIPLGSGVDLYRAHTLRRLDTLATTPSFREHINAYLFEHADAFDILRIPPPAGLHKPELRLTVDTAEDLERVRSIIRSLDVPPDDISMVNIVRLSNEKPELLAADTMTFQQYVSEAARRMRQAQ